LVVVLIVWTAVVIEWGDRIGIWVPDDPYDGGAILAAQFGGVIAVFVWLVGFAVIGLVGVCVNAWLKRARR
jgi:hypothetical protein